MDFRIFRDFTDFFGIFRDLNPKKFALSSSDKSVDGRPVFHGSRICEIGICKNEAIGSSSVSLIRFYEVQISANQVTGSRNFDP